MRRTRVGLVTAVVAVLVVAGYTPASAFAGSLGTPQYALLSAELAATGMPTATLVGGTQVAVGSATVSATGAAATTVLPTAAGVSASTAIGGTTGALVGAVGAVAGLFGIELDLSEGSDWEPPVGPELAPATLKETQARGGNSYEHTTYWGGTFGGTSWTWGFSAIRVVFGSTSAENSVHRPVYGLCRTSGGSALALEQCGARNVSGTTNFTGVGPWSGSGTISGWTVGYTFDRMCVYSFGLVNAPEASPPTFPAGPHTGCPSTVGGRTLMDEWLPEGHPNIESGPESGTVTSTLICESIGGPRTVTATGPSLQLSNGAHIVAPDVACSPGEVATRSTIDWTGDTSGQVKELVPAVDAPDWVVAMPAEYPDCMGEEACPLVLRRVDVEPDLDCTVVPTSCVRWEFDLNRDSKYECWWGPYQVALRQCAVFRETPSPTYPPSLDALPPPETIGQPAPDETSDCWPSGWGVLNPVGWVLQPVKCALEWAFVPSPTVVDSVVADVSEEWESGPLDDIAGVVGGMQGTISTWSAAEVDCAGPVFHGGGVGPLSDAEWTLRPLYACDAPVSTLASVIRLVMTVGLWLGAAYSAYYLIVRTLGWTAANAP